MERSESVVELLAALCAARLEFPTIVRNREGFSKRGGQKYGYADLNAIIDATVPKLAAHGLTLMQFIEDAPETTHAVVKSWLAHQSGEWIASSLTVPRQEDPQNFAILTTYAKRYAQQAMLNISTEDDPDGVTSDTKDAGRGQKSAARPSATQAKRHEHEDQPESHATTPTTKPTSEEITQLMELLRGTYPTLKAVEDHLRLILKIPANVPCDDRRVKMLMTRDAYTRLQDEATAYALEQASREDDVPLTPGPDEPETAQVESSTPDETQESHDADAFTMEAAEGIQDEMVDVDADDIPPIEVDADGCITQSLGDALHRRAAQYGQEPLLRQMLGSATRMKPAIFRYAWVQVATKKGAKV